MGLRKSVELGQEHLHPLWPVLGQLPGRGTERTWYVDTPTVPDGRLS